METLLDGARRSSQRKLPTTGMYRPMSKRTILGLFLLFVLVQGCSTQSDSPTPRNSSAPDSNNKKKDDSTARQDSLSLRNAITERLKRRGFTGEVRGIGVIDYVGDMFFSARIVAVETIPQMTVVNTLTYFVVYDLEDKDGNTYPHAEFLSGMNAGVVYLIKNKRPPTSEPEKE
jgi:hypothetical protein